VGVALHTCGQLLRRHKVVLQRVARTHLLEVLLMLLQQGEVRRRAQIFARVVHRL